MISAALATACRLVTGSMVEWHTDPFSDVQRVYFGNHSSHLDFIVIWSALPASLRRRTVPVAGVDYWGAGPVRRYLADKVFHAVLVARRSPESESPSAVARASFKRMTDALDAEKSLIVFPEGTRSVNEDVGPFKSGLFHLARARPSAALIPVYLENLNRILPKGESLPVPMLSRVVFGAQLPNGAGEDKAAFLARARTALVELRNDT